MSDEGSRQYHNQLPPVQSTTPGEGVTFLATAVTAAHHDLNAYPAFFGRYIEFQASGNDIWISFSTDGATEIDKTGAAGATIAEGTAKANPILLKDGVAVRFRLYAKLHRYLHVQAVASTPKLIIHPVSQQTLAAASMR